MQGLLPLLNADAERRTRITRFKQLTESLLPARAQALHWPIRLDHCFKRICLDYAFEDIWYNHLKRPAERHIEGAALDRALCCAEELLEGDRALLDHRNLLSLGYRGKRKPAAAAHETEGGFA